MTQALSIDDIYCNKVATILEFGSRKTPTRGQENVTPTIYYPHMHVRYDMSVGFPLLTVKKMPFKSVCVELEGFLKGITNKEWYIQRGCHFWDHWQSKKATDSRDLGPLGYAWQWRNFNQPYDALSFLETTEDSTSVGQSQTEDQLLTIVETLKNNPYDRRMVCSAWNPLQIDDMALPPCHVIWGLTTGADRKLSLWVTMRSCDVGIGLPCNIASYGLLLTLLCKCYDFTPDILSIFIADAHIYENHAEPLLTLLDRDIFPAPTLICKPINEITDWSHNMCELENYCCHDKLTLPITI